MWFCLDICQKNQAVVNARRHAHKEGRHLDASIRTTPPVWVHRCDPCFATEMESDDSERGTAVIGREFNSLLKARGVDDD